jgi:TonB family protein
MAAVGVGVVVRSMTGGPAAEPDVVDIDVAPLINSPAENPPARNDTLHRVDQEPVPGRLVLMRRAKATLARATAGASGPSIVSAPVETDGPARFALSGGTVATRAGATSATASRSSSRNEPEGDTDAVSERDVNVPARLLSSSPLVYPAVARQAEIEIDFPVEIVVDADGRVAAARAVSRVGYGLDEAALRAIRQYRFSPALRAGRPVRVRMRWTVQFRLR